MEILLAILLLLAVITIGFLLVRVKKLKKENEELKRQAIFLSKKDMEFLEFAADMYVKYSIELKIHSKEQHEFIIAELERLRKILNERISSLSEEQRLP
jgi:flagellar basal body-associated protein FliL